MPDDDPETGPPTAAAPARAWAGGAGRVRPGLGAVLLVLALWTGLSSLPLLPGRLGLLGTPPVPQALAALLLVFCIALGRWNATGLRPALPGTWRLMLLPWLYLPLFAAALLVIGPPPAMAMLGIALIMVWVALSEEVMFRGLLFPALRRHLRLWPAIWVTTLAFGALHLGNGWLSGDHAGAVVQSLAALATGLLLLAIRLRRGSIWPAILYHLLWNIGVFGIGLAEEARGAPVLDSAGAVLLPLLFVLPNGLYSLWLLRRSGQGALPGDPGGA